MTDDYGVALLEAVDGAVAGWVMRDVERRAGRPLAAEERAAAEQAAADAREWVHHQLGLLLSTDIDEQRSNPLSVLRAAVRYSTGVLQAMGAPPVARDDFALRSFPDDVYDLSPATWADVDPSLQEPGLTWGAWKAHQHLQRHRRAH